jgi:hypothetical protein
MKTVFGRIAAFFSAVVLAFAFTTPASAQTELLTGGHLEGDVVNSAFPPFFTFDGGPAEFSGTFVTGNYTFQLSGTQLGLDAQYYSPPSSSPGVISFTAFDGVNAVAAGNILLDPGAPTFLQTLTFSAGTPFDKITLDGVFVSDPNALVSRVVLQSAALTAVTPVPEPQSYALALGALCALAGVNRRMKRT